METNSDRSSSSLLLELPEHVLVELLLLKLPVESLIILRSVCKLLKTYISSDSFSRFHLHLWGNRDMDTKNIFLGNDVAPNDLQYASRGRRLCMKLARIALNPRKPGNNNCRFLFEQELSTLQFGGCCDGILCFYEFRYPDSRRLVIYICNPALNQCRLVWRRRSMMYDKAMTKVCFVHDPASKDYKVVVASVSDGHKIPKVYVYGLKDCRWTKMDTIKAGTVPSDVELWGDDDPPSMSDLVVENGRVYWMSTHEGYYNVLNVLDLHKQSVGEIALPHELRNKSISSGCFSLVRHQGSLGLCWTFPSRINWGPVELRVMKEAENDGISWGETVSINLRFACNSCDIGWCFCYKGYPCKMASSTTSWGYLFMSDKNHPYDYVMGNIKSSESVLGSFFIPESPQSRCVYVAFDYVPSLVSVVRARIRRT